jgi:NAD(P)-dependent dehydrogenase (short-subunit alcohol dehydrogenase family)
MLILDKVFLVTGGGSGLGAAVARMFVAEGAQVVIADVNAEAGSAIAASLVTSVRTKRARAPSSAAIADPASALTSAMTT